VKPNGCAPPHSAPTTASFPRAAWLWAWLRPSPPKRPSCSPRWRVSWPAPSPWQRASTSRSAPKRIPSTLISPGSEAERAELAGIYMARGLSRDLAIQVADQLMAHDALGAHARDELGIHETTRARPIQAAVASAASFAVGAAPPALLAALLPAGGLALDVMGVTLGLLLVLGGVAARLGGASLTRGALRVAFWGAVAMGCTAAVGRLFGAVV